MHFCLEPIQEGGVLNIAIYHVDLYSDWSPSYPCPRSSHVTIVLSSRCVEGLQLPQKDNRPTKKRGRKPKNQQNKVRLRCVLLLIPVQQLDSYLRGWMKFTTLAPTSAVHVTSLELAPFFYLCCLLFWGFPSFSINPVFCFVFLLGS